MGPWHRQSAGVAKGSSPRLQSHLRTHAATNQRLPIDLSSGGCLSPKGSDTEKPTIQGRIIFAARIEMNKLIYRNTTGLLTVRKSCKAFVIFYLENIQKRRSQPDTMAPRPVLNFSFGEDHRGSCVLDFWPLQLVDN